LGEVEVPKIFNESIKGIEEETKQRIIFVLGGMSETNAIIIFISEQIKRLEITLPEGAMTSFKSATKRALSVENVDNEIKIVDSEIKTLGEEIKDRYNEIKDEADSNIPYKKGVIKTITRKIREIAIKTYLRNCLELIPKQPTIREVVEQIAPEINDTIKYINLEAVKRTIREVTGQQVRNTNVRMSTPSWWEEGTKTEDAIMTGSTLRWMNEINPEGHIISLRDYIKKLVGEIKDYTLNSQDRSTREQNQLLSKQSAKLFFTLLKTRFIEYRHELKSLGIKNIRINFNKMGEDELNDLVSILSNAKDLNYQHRPYDQRYISRYIGL